MPASPYAPQLATLADAPPSGDDWLHEIKLDGYRIGCLIGGRRATLITRNGNDWTAAFPEVAQAALDLPVRDALIDGEVVMLLPDGRTSFQALQNAASGRNSRDRLVYFAFDLLRLDGERLEQLPLEERKQRLRSLIQSLSTPRIRYTDHVVGRGAAFFDRACSAGLEGIVSKRRTLPYVAGRHGGWLKIKCKRRQEFVIGGFTDPEGSRAGIGALLIGYNKDGRLVFAGKVGTGFSHQGAVDLRRQLEGLERKTSPFSPPEGAGPPPEGAGPAKAGHYVPIRGAHWVNPVLVTEVEFTEWTADGKVRHPSFRGLRTDKDSREVVQEEVAASGGSHVRPVVAGVAISNADRVVYPSPRLTKLDVARYYDAIHEWIVPHVAGRPLTLVRCPEGLTGGCFYMKHALVWAPQTLRRVRIQEKSKVGQYLVADDVAGIVGLAQMGVLEIHTWNSTIDDVERPNRLVIDLDPDEEVEWPQVIAAAREVRSALQALDLESWVKTTGGRGLHVVVPLEPHADWADCLTFSRALSEALERSSPARYTTEFAKARRKGRILIDYLRNNRANTSVAAFSTRAREGAPVSMPLTWQELRASLQPAAFTAVTVPARLKRTGDPWKDYWSCRQRLTRQRVKAVIRSG